MRFVRFVRFVRAIGMSLCTPAAPRPADCLSPAAMMRARRCRPRVAALRGASASGVLTNLPELLTVGILGGCSFDRPLVDLSTNRVAE